jgi:hypothetical protein
MASEIAEYDGREIAGEEKWFWRGGRRSCEIDIAVVAGKYI